MITKTSRNDMKTWRIPSYLFTVTIIDGHAEQVKIDSPKSQAPIIITHGEEKPILYCSCNFCEYIYIYFLDPFTNRKIKILYFWSSRTKDAISQKKRNYFQNCIFCAKWYEHQQRTICVLFVVQRRYLGSKMQVEIFRRAREMGNWLVEMPDLLAKVPHWCAMMTLVPSLMSIQDGDKFSDSIFWERREIAGLGMVLRKSIRHFFASKSYVWLYDYIFLNMIRKSQNI